MTKEQRAAEALKRRQEEVSKQRKLQDEERKIIQSMQMSRQEDRKEDRDRDRRPRDREREEEKQKDKDKEKEQDAIKERHVVCSGGVPQFLTNSISQILGVDQEEAPG